MANCTQSHVELQVSDICCNWVCDQFSDETKLRVNAQLLSDIFWLLNVYIRKIRKCCKESMLLQIRV